MLNSNFYSLATDFFDRNGAGTDEWQFPFTFGPCSITEQQLKLVNESFPEFDVELEPPLLFFFDGIFGQKSNRWLLLTGSALYIRLRYNPLGIIVLDHIPLSLIHSIGVKYYMFKDHVLMINGLKISSITLGSKNEAVFINDLTALVLNEFGKHEDLEPEVRIGNASCDLPNGNLFIIAENYFSEHNLGRREWGFGSSFYYGDYIPFEEITEARTAYANYDQQIEKEILFINNTIAGVTPVSGLVITNKNFYYCLAKSYRGGYSSGTIPLMEIKKFIIECKLLSAYIIINNNTKLQLGALNIYSKRESKAITEVMNLFIEEIKNSAK